MASLNKVFVLGNLGRDPELRHTSNGRAVATLRLATNESWTDKETQERKEKTEWHQIVVWGRQAENCAQYLQKGRQAFVEGKLQTRKWQDKDGNDRYSTEIVADRVQFVGSAGASAGAMTVGDEAMPPPPPGGGDDIPF